jgi:hypothetical protein
MIGAVEPDTVVVATAHIDDETTRMVAAACDRLQARYLPWTDREQSLLQRPSLLVAGLPVGQRRVPADLMRLCTEIHPGTPLLLLCHEGLVSPTVSLHDGQIVLVGPPHSTARIFSRLAVLQAERRSDEQGPSMVLGVDEPTGRVWTRERLHADVWIASFGCRGGAGGSGYQPVLSSCAEGVTALLPSRAGVMISDEQRLGLIDVFRTTLDSDERMRRARVAAPELAIVNFDRRTEEWSFGWPHAELQLWMHSDTRLPPVTNLAATVINRGQRTMRAYAGDLVVGLTAPSTDQQDPTGGYDHVMRRGGHALLAALERQLEIAPRNFAGIMIEVRA